MNAQGADVILENAWIYTGESPLPAYGGLAMGGGRILSTDAEQVASLAGAATERIDLGGRLIVPGFQDAHVHPISAGVELLSCDLTACDTAEETFEAIRAYAAGHPDLPWITGAGWAMDAFPGGTPTRGMLDAIVQDRPVLLQNRDHHGAWANTRAFEAAGITASTPDPADGRLEREADGTPAGTVHEGATALFADARPAPSFDGGYAGLLAAQQRLVSYGITGWQDAGVGNFMLDGMPSIPIYLRAVASGALKARVRGAQWWDRTEGLAQLASMVSWRDEVAARCPASRFSVGSVKLMVDGVAENFTAAMHDCYLDRHGHETPNRGLSFFDPSDLREFVTAIDAAGLQAHFHALGDRAVTEALDAVAAARAANGPSMMRHHLAHLQMVRASDIARFVELDATANLQALWACHEDQLDELTLPFLGAGPDAAEARHYPFGDLAVAGARLAAGSDWPVSSPSPIEAIHVAVNRVSPGSSLPQLGPDSQKLTPGRMLNAYTSGTAYVNHLDEVVGRLTPGRFADLAVIDRNLFGLDPSELASARVDETWIGGEQVYLRA